MDRIRDRCRPEGERCIWWMVGKRRRAVVIGSLTDGGEEEEDWRERRKISSDRKLPTEWPARMISSNGPLLSFRETRE